MPKTILPTDLFTFWHFGNGARLTLFFDLTRLGLMGLLAVSQMGNTTLKLRQTSSNFVIPLLTLFILFLSVQFLVDGHWSTWSSWSDCLAVCGSGTRQRTRECNEPKPMYGGKQCVGRKQQHTACWAGHCDIGKHHFVSKILGGGVGYLSTFCGTGTCHF